MDKKEDKMSTEGGGRMSLIQINHMSFCYEGAFEPVFEDVSFQLDTDWRLGLTGRNGRGKTTLLRLLEGKYPYEGQIISSVRFQYFPFSVKEEDQDTMQIVEEMNPSCEFWQICCELSLLGMDTEVMYRPFSSLSRGEQTKVMLAVLFAGENQFLLIDEPTNHLDMEARQMVMEYLKKKKGFILVSHDRYFLDGCVDHILAVNRADIEVIKGNFTTWEEEKEKKDIHEISRNEKLKKDIRRLESAARQAGKWSDDVEKTKKGTRTAGLRPDRGYIGHKAAKMMKRSKNIESRMEAAADEKRGLLKNIETVEDLKLYPLRHHRECLVSMEDVSLKYRGSGKTILENWNMEIKQGERVLLHGRNGSGKSSILKAILQESGSVIIPERKMEEAGENKKKEDTFSQLEISGKINLAGGLVISYVAQDTSGLAGTLREYARIHEIDETLFLALLRKLDFSRAQFEKRIEDYSQGQKKKVLLAGSLCQKAHLYIWDEPMNYIDIFSRRQIMELIRKYKPAMLLVEHDRDFADYAATRIIDVK